MSSSFVGDPRDRTFERLYERYVNEVYRYVLAMVRNPAEAEDVTQTTFLNAYRAMQAAALLGPCRLGTEPCHPPSPRRGSPGRCRHARCRRAHGELVPSRPPERAGPCHVLTRRQSRSPGPLRGRFSLQPAVAATVAASVPQAPPLPVETPDPPAAPSPPIPVGTPELPVTPPPLPAAPLRQRASFLR
jgi:hypothetical protein